MFDALSIMSLISPSDWLVVFLIFLMFYMRLADGNMTLGLLDYLEKQCTGKRSLLSVR